MKKILLLLLFVFVSNCHGVIPPYFDVNNKMISCYRDMIGEEMVFEVRDTEDIEKFEVEIDERVINKIEYKEGRIVIKIDYYRDFNHKIKYRLHPTKNDRVIPKPCEDSYGL